MVELRGGQRANIISLMFVSFINLSIHKGMVKLFIASKCSKGLKQVLQMMLKYNADVMQMML